MPLTDYESIQVNWHRVIQDEKNDCALVATKFVSGKEYKEIHQLYKEKGRVNGRGTQKSTIFDVLGDLDLAYSYVKKPAKTIRKLEGLLDKTKKYLVFTRGHVLACVGGEVKDWTKGRLHRIIDMYEITELPKLEIETMEGSDFA